MADFSSLRSLRGKRIVVTRARHQAGPLADMILAFGGVPIRYPCIAIEAPADSGPLDASLMAISGFDWLALTSGNVARALADRLRELGVAPDWSRIKIAALGPSTQAELSRWLAIDSDFMPAAAAAALARELPVKPRSRVLLPQSDLASSRTAAILRERGATVTSVIAYRTVIGEGGADVPDLLARGAVDALTFMSPSAVAYFRQRCPSPLALRLPAACVGEATAAAARGQGFANVVEAAAHSQGNLLGSLAQTLAHGAAHS